MKAAIPVLRSFDEAVTKAFYLDFLGFEVVFEHRFSPDAPLYLGVRQGGCEIHLSEHFGDGTPGTVLRIEVEEVAALCASLIGKHYKHAKPDWQRQPWGWDEMCIADPSGNKLIFASPNDAK
ncbi:glyoxalase superfamily protein [Sulfitobacter sp. F26169L]|uniref:glyoxalase superfamily protein n=1 Tax=Sulfitobacter sp. F26169L TaxID=2996015 RepID=UPI002260FB61|nr:glyoxalase superfamily protein [Sulfitobacter sp. F26169L]MCX7564896.1 glyoxalase superfamily protein [Sulfitobacter sp. F26169L]